MNSKLIELLRSFGKTGTKFDVWHINMYSTPEGEDINGIDGTCVTVDSADGQAYAEWVFDENGDLLQFIVWHD